MIYQVVWVHVFGNVFGNTVYSASIVVAVFMLGLGVGGYLVGAWADRPYSQSIRGHCCARTGASSSRIAALGLGISALLPHLGQLSAVVVLDGRDAEGWNVLTAGSYLARAGIAMVLLTPIAVLMGGTLTLLIRHLVRGDVEISGWRIAVLYSVNTAGAALGCLLTDFALVPAYGLRNTQFIAVALNALAGVGALYLATGRLKLRTGLRGKWQGAGFSQRQSNRNGVGGGFAGPLGADARSSPGAWSPKPRAPESGSLEAGPA